MDDNYQLDQWVDGNSLHDDSKSDGGECCPDFSCCRPELLVSRETRETFRDATDEERAVFLMSFLQAAIAKYLESKNAPKVVCISADIPTLQ